MLDLWQGTPDAMGIAHGIGGLIILFERLGRAVDAVTLHAALMHYLPSLRMLEELPLRSSGQELPWTTQRLMRQHGAEPPWTSAT